MKRALLLLLLAGCGKDPSAAPAAPAESDPPQLPLKTLGGFEYKEKMALPEEVTRWNGKRIRATGFINPTRQARDLTKFLLVKDLGSCCFGKSPQMNHYIEVTLKAGQKAHYSRDPVTVEGVLVVDERWDGDWPLGLYWMEGAEVVE